MFLFFVFLHILYWVIIMNDVYVVKRGDTLWGISNQYGVSVTELASLNGVNADTLQVGQRLIIPAKSGSNPDNMFLYTVKKGDTLYSIARVYGVSVDSIQKLNYLSSNNLYIGQVIRIPEIYTKPDDMNVPEYINYKVKKGDSLYSIGRSYGVDVNTLMQDNGLKNTNLSIGQNLKIRTGNQVSIEECFGEEYSPVTDSLYTVKKGDSLYSIAKKFNTTVDSIKKKNNLTSNILMVNQILKI